MPNSKITQDLTGSDETLDELLERLRTFRMTPAPRKPRGGRDRWFTSRWPRCGAGGAEAPIPVERPLADLYAPH